MLRLEFRESDQQALNHERYHHPHPRVQQRLEALWLKRQGLPHHQRARLCGISGNTLRAYLKQYQTGGGRGPETGVVSPPPERAAYPS